MLLFLFVFKSNNSQQTHGSHTQSLQNSNSKPEASVHRRLAEPHNGTQTGKANKYFTFEWRQNPSVIRFLRFACINGRYLAFADHMILSSHPEGSVGGREVPVIYVVVNAMI